VKNFIGQIGIPMAG